MNSTETTWEPIENLYGAIELVEAFKASKKEIDQIIGCGKRNGKKYFLVRFKGSAENELIDWDEAKKYSLAVMEFFGARLAWSAIDSTGDSDRDDDQDDENEGNNAKRKKNNEDLSRPSTSTRPPNEIEYSR